MHTHRLNGSAGGVAGAQTVLTTPVPPGHRMLVTFITAIDKTTAQATSNVIGIENGGSKIALDFKAGAVAAGVVHNLEVWLWLNEGDRIYSTFNDATDGDALEVYAFGELHPISC